MGKPENAIQKLLDAYFKTNSMLKMFRNNTGAYNVGGRYIRFGLKKGSGDSIGWHTIKITPSMVGKHVAVFTSIETKTADGRVSPDQRRWDELVDASGGISIIARCPEDVESGLARFEKRLKWRDGK